MNHEDEEIYQGNTIRHTKRVYWHQWQESQENKIVQRNWHNQEYNPKDLQPIIWNKSEHLKELVLP